MRRILACVCAMVVLAFISFGQSTQKSPAFEIADVHPSPPSVANGLVGMSAGIPRAGRYELRNATMLDLLTTAYGVTDDRIFGGPNWLATDRFDVIAKTPPDATKETARAMLQTLLADRFKLTVHDDNKPISVYVLSPGKGRHKLKSSDGNGTSGCQGQQQPPAQPGAAPYLQGSCHNLTGEGIAENLRRFVDRRIVDQTKLEGTWDFDIKLTPPQLLSSAGSDGISIFDAVDKQLGLKLELQQVTMPVIVVDNVNRKPTDNPAEVAKILPPEKPEFETAEIKPIPPGEQPGLGIRYTQGGRIDAFGSLRDLLSIAYQIPPNLASDLLAGPKFLETERFSIVAKAPSTGIGAPNREGGRETAPPIGVALMMLQNLLVERFKITSHKEDRPVTVYAVVLPKGESKLKKADAADRANCKQDPGVVPPNSGPMGAFTCQNTTIAELATNLPQWANAYIDHPVLDTTGLQGGFNFSLYWTPRGAFENASRPAEAGAGAVAQAAAPAGDPGAITIFTAIEKQLGLKLEKGTHPFPVVVIDHIEEKPID
jgi:uncharacterized protein (TIGR03435 family)